MKVDNILLTVSQRIFTLVFRRNISFLLSNLRNLWANFRQRSLLCSERFVEQMFPMHFHSLCIHLLGWFCRQCFGTLSMSLSSVFNKSKMFFLNYHILTFMVLRWGIDKTEVLYDIACSVNICHLVTFFCHLLSYYGILHYLMLSNVILWH